MMKETLRIKMREIFTSDKTKEEKIILFNKLIKKFTTTRHWYYHRKDSDIHTDTLTSKYGGVSHRH